MSTQVKVMYNGQEVEGVEVDSLVVTGGKMTLRLEDGTSLVVMTVVGKVVRLPFYDEHNDPLYLVMCKNNFFATSPEDLKAKIPGSFTQ